MFTKVVSVWRSLLRLFTRRSPQEVSKQEVSEPQVSEHVSKQEVNEGNTKPSTPATRPVTVVREGSAAMNPGFDMKTEIARLSTRILEPVAAGLASQDLQPLIEQIRRAFEHLIATRATVGTDFSATALAILEPIRPKVSEIDFARVVDRLRGAMAEFCRGDLAKAKSTAEPPRTPVDAVPDPQHSRNEEAQV